MNSEILTNHESTTGPLTEQDLINLTVDTAIQYGYTVEVLPDPYRANFENDPEAVKNASLCVDPRTIEETLTLDDGEKTTTKFNRENKYKAPQSPGATSGEIDITRAVTGLNEERTREVVGNAYKIAGRTMGAHSSVDHGNMGCGHQAKSAEGNIPSAIHVHDEGGQNLVESRQDWIIFNGGEYIILRGEHEENGFVITTKESDYYVINQKHREFLFNGNLAEFYGLTEHIYSQLTDEEKAGYSDENDFRKRMVTKWVKMYLETVIALDPERNLDTLYINASPSTTINSIQN